MAADNSKPILSVTRVRKTFQRETGELVVALDNVSLSAQRGSLTALVGPDGAGKTTLIRLIAGLMFPDHGQLNVLGIDVVAEPQEVQSRLAYMPQRFGLYEDLSVQENLDLYADMHGVSQDQRSVRYPQLFEMTALEPFLDRLAGRLSGGMKQKLGLACALVGSPELLLLDEPTVGVDPLSRRDLWKIIHHLVEDEQLTVVLSTSYLDEAEHCDHVLVLNRGKVLADGSPDETRQRATGHVWLAEPSNAEPARNLQDQMLDNPAVVDAVPEGGRVRIVAKGECAPSNGDRKPAWLKEIDAQLVEPRFEDGFMILLRQSLDANERVKSFTERAGEPVAIAPSADEEPIVAVHDLSKKFGQFVAVDHVSFEVRRGEVFGLLGPNGAGKTTTFRMLCGLSAATEGTLRVAGVDVRLARASARQRIGYVAQKFSLYGQLSVDENLDFFASAYGLRGKRRRERIDWARAQFELAPFARLTSGQLPGGYKQRLSMAAALLHEPEILFLDEPTSGADPLARREFWRRITALAMQGVTTIVTTHFMEEAEYCNRIVILDAGKVLAQGTPAEVRNRGQGKAGRSATMEDAFIAIVDEARGVTT